LIFSEVSQFKLIISLRIFGNPLSFTIFNLLHLTQEESELGEDWKQRIQGISRTMGVLSCYSLFICGLYVVRKEPASVVWREAMARG